MNFFDIDELVSYGVYDAGIANLERVVFRVAQAIDLGNFALLIGVRGPNGTAYPLRDNLLWFGQGWVQPNDWIFVYTAPGEARVTVLPNNAEKLYAIHWGKPATVFNGGDLVPILIRMDAVAIAPNLLALPEPQQMATLRRPSITDQGST